MTINQTLDKLEEQLAGILPAFMMLGIAVFIVLGLGACVAPVSALSSSDIDFSSLPEFLIDTERTLTSSSSVTFDSYYYRGTYVVESLFVPAGTSVLNLYLTTSGTISESTLCTLSSDNPDYIFVFSLSTDSVTTSLRVLAFSLSSTTFPDDYSEWLGLELFPGNFGDDSSCLVSTPFVTLGGSSVYYNSENNVVYYDFGDYYFGASSYPSERTVADSSDYVFAYSSPYIVYQGRDISSEFNSENPLQYENAVGFPVASAYYIGAAISGSTEDPYGWEEYFNDYFMGIYFDTLKSLSISYPDLIFVYCQDKWYYPRSYFSVFAFPADVLYTASEPKPDEPSGEGHQFDINYNADSDTYDVSLKRNGEPWYLSIKGKAFGWLPVYTYTDVSIPSEDGKEEVFNDLSLSGLPTRFFMFDLDYHASVYRAGSGLSSNDYKGYSYYWTRSDFIGENGVVNPDPVIEPEPEEKVDFTPTVKPPFVEPGGYDMPNVGTGGGGSGGVLSSLGVPEGIEFPSIESLEQMIANMRLPSSLKDMFKYPMPEDYKASYNISSTHVLYGYVNGWFTTTETTIDLVFGVVFVLFALIAVIPRLVFEFFSTLIEWLSTAFQSFYDWLVIPSEIFKLVVGLLPDELLAIALLLFGIDLLFLFFQFVVPGLIGGSHALGDIVEYDDALRLAEEERIKAEEHIGSGHGWHPKKGGVKHVVVKRPSSSIRGKGDYDPDAEAAEHIREVHKRMYPSRRRK